MIGKCYLELRNDNSADIATVSPLKFLGFKWSMNSSSIAVVSRYRSSPVTSWDGLCRKMQSNVESRFRPSISDLLQPFRPTLAASELSELRLLEVEEEGSDRRSCDLNVYAQQAFGE